MSHARHGLQSVMLGAASWEGFRSADNAGDQGRSQLNASLLVTPDMREPSTYAGLRPPPWKRSMAFAPFRIPPRRLCSRVLGAESSNLRQKGTEVAIAGWAFAPDTNAAGGAGGGPSQPGRDRTFVLRGCHLRDTSGQAYWPMYIGRPSTPSHALRCPPISLDPGRASTRLYASELARVTWTTSEVVREKRHSAEEKHPALKHSRWPSPPPRMEAPPLPGGATFPEKRQADALLARRSPKLSRPSRRGTPGVGASREMGRGEGERPPRKKGGRRQQCLVAESRKHSRGRGTRHN
jgi:hypothetical protein